MTKRSIATPTIADTRKATGNATASEYWRKLGGSALWTTKVA